MNISFVIRLIVISLISSRSLAANENCQLTSLQVAAGYVTFANVIQFLAVLGGALFTGILIYQLRHQFEKVPVKVWKGLGYTVVVLFCVSDLWMSSDAVAYGEFFGASLSIGAFYFVVRDIFEPAKWRSRYNSLWTLSFALFGITLALLQSNSMVAAVGVLGLVSFLGFTVLSSPGRWVLGFYNPQALFRSTAAALMLLIPATFLKVNFVDVAGFDIFWPAIAWICTFVASTGLVISSSRFYGEGRGGWQAYLVRNLMMLMFGMFCIWAGSVHGLIELQRIGGTFLVLWLFEKPWDIPQEGKAWYAFLGAVSCLAIFLAMQELGRNPDRYRDFLLF